MQSIVHRDLKPANIMVSDDGVLKLVDFGLARFYNGSELMNTQYGSPYYMAPEQLERKKYDDKADMWSVGVILF